MMTDIISQLESERSRIDQAVAILRGHGANGVPVETTVNGPSPLVMKRMVGTLAKLGRKAREAGEKGSRRPYKRRGLDAAAAAGVNGTAALNGDGGEAPQSQGGRLRLLIAKRPAADVFDQNNCAEWLGPEADPGKIKGCLSYWAKCGELDVVEVGRPNYPTRFKRTASFKAVVS